jgi:hypothetical protein
LVDDEHEHRFAEHEHEHEHELEYRSGARIGRARAQPLAAVLVLVIERPLRGPNRSSIMIGSTFTGSQSSTRPRRFASPRACRKLQRIVSMLTRMAMKGDGVGESQAEYRELVEHEHEHELEYRSGARIGRARAQPLAAVLVLSRLRRCSCS